MFKKLLISLSIIALLAVTPFTARAQVAQQIGTVNINILEGCEISVDILHIFFDPPAELTSAWYDQTGAFPTIDISWAFSGGNVPRVFLKLGELSNNGHLLETLNLFSFSAINGWVNGDPMVGVMSRTLAAATTIYTSTLTNGSDTGQVEIDLDGGILMGLGPLEAGTYVADLTFGIAIL